MIQRRQTAIINEKYRKYNSSRKKQLVTKNPEKLISHVRHHSRPSGAKIRFYPYNGRTCNATMSIKILVYTGKTKGTAYPRYRTVRLSLVSKG